MNTWPSIHREGALALFPDDVAKGNKELDALIESTARCIAKREALLTGSYGLSGAVFLTSCAAYLMFSYQEPPWALASNLALVAGALSVTAAALTWWGWTAIQHGRFTKRLGDLSGVTIPPPLQELIDSFASGLREVRTARGDKVFPGMFASRWAIMLFSHDHRQRLWVRGPRGEKHEPQIYAQPKEQESVLPADVVPAQGEDEPPLRNFDPEMAWLVDGIPQQFAEGLNNFLDTLPPHQVDAYRLTLTVARRELRKGGQPGAQEEAIRIILAELAEQGLLIRGTSRTTIMKLLHGNHRGADIRGHFRPGDGPQSANAPDSSG